MVKSKFSIPREGFYLDTLAEWTRATILNPYLSSAGFITAKGCLHFLRKANGASSPALEYLAGSLLYLTIIGSGLCVNDSLNIGCLNNWVKDTSWDWSEEVVVITGGSSGIGASVTHQLLSRNARTVIVIVDYSPLAFTPPPSARLHYFQCDLSDADALQETCAKIKNEVGPSTVLINNAGVTRGATVADGSYHDVQFTFRTNVIAPFLLTKEFLPHMIKRNHGHVVGISSMSAIISPARLADYAASKAGILALSETLRQELRFVHKADRVRVSTAVLGFIKTPMFRGETNQPQFLSPLIHVDTVGEAIADVLYKAEARTIWYPGLSSVLASLRGGPEWLMEKVRDGSQALNVDFVGRQEIDPRTGKLPSVEASEGFLHGARYVDRDGSDVSLGGVSG